eukprot:312030_1
MNEEDEKCNESYPSEADDQYQEAIVTGSDGRRRVDVFKPTSDDIFSCIGQLDVEYDFMKLHKYRGFVKGTGTVIYVGNQNRYKNKSAYILTCAHNVRLSVIHCVKKTCDTYRRKRDSKGNKTKCIVCNQIYGYQKFVKPTKIIFRDRSIEYNNYGKTLENYECKELEIPDKKFASYGKPKDGFDWCYLCFYDDGNYEKRLNQINIQLLNGLNIFKNGAKGKTFGIFGYPMDKKWKMVGMTTDKSNRFEIRKNATTKRDYLYQIGIDTQGGESGSLLWFKESNTIKVCGIHVGGSNGTKRNPQPYNIATLINTQIIEIFKQIKRNNKMLGIKLIIDRIGVNDMDFKVIWDDKGLDCDYKENKIDLNVQIKEDDECVFVDKVVTFKGNGKSVNISDLEKDTLYWMRCKCVVNDNDNKNEDDWGDAIFTSFQTNKEAIFLDDSKIICNPNALLAFKNMLVQKIKCNMRLTLLYRSNQQDRLKDANEFHSACNGKGISVTIIKSESKNIFGGCTKIPWTSPNSMFGESKTDESSFLFLFQSTDQVKTYENKNNNGDSAVFHHTQRGPIFGVSDIRVQGSNSFCESNSIYNITANEFVGGDSKEDEHGRVGFKYILYEVYLLEIE